MTRRSITYRFRHKFRTVGDRQVKLLALCLENPQLFSKQAQEWVSDQLGTVPLFINVGKYGTTDQKRIMPA